ncbi:glycosyltransferase family 2 protein [candidate division WOR-3 bacterium]|nr:glycosyltransferase family 2 protein [candidate division WOR-3 bacterium]
MSTFSVIIPLYNKEKYIRRAIDSVLAQTCQDFAEIIVVDDGSTDHSVDIVQSIKDPRIRLVRQENRGWPAAKNHAVRLAECELTAHLDADDEWAPEFLSVIKRLVEKYPGCGAYSTAYRVVGKNGQARSISDMKRVGIPAGEWEGILPNYFKASLGGYSALSNSSVVIPKSTFQAVGPFEVKDIPSADLDMWYRIAVRFRLAFSSRAGAIYHKDATGRVSRSKRMMSGSILQTLSEGLKLKDLPDGVATKDIERTHFQWVIGLATYGIEKGRSGRDVRRFLQRAAPSRRLRPRLLILYLLSLVPFPSLRAAILLGMRSLRNPIRRLLAGVG